MAWRWVRAVAPNKIVTTVSNMLQCSLWNFDPKCVVASSASKSSPFALNSSMQSKELIITKTNVGSIIVDIASDWKSAPCEMIKSVAKVVHIAIANPQYKSRALWFPSLWRRSRFAGELTLSGLFLFLINQVRQQADQSFPRSRTCQLQNRLRL